MKRRAAYPRNLAMTIYATSIPMPERENKEVLIVSVFYQAVSLEY